MSCTPLEDEDQTIDSKSKFYIGDDTNPSSFSLQVCLLFRFKIKVLIIKSNSVN